MRMRRIGIGQQRLLQFCDGGLRQHHDFAPICTRLYRSITSSFARRMQPLDTCLPIVEGALVPWMRYCVPPIYMARAPSGLPGPPAVMRGR